MVSYDFLITSEVDSFEEVGAVGTAVVVTPIRCRLKGFFGVGPRVAAMDWFKEV